MRLVSLSSLLIYPLVSPPMGGALVTLKLEGCSVRHDPVAFFLRRHEVCSARTHMRKQSHDLSLRAEKSLRSKVSLFSIASPRSTSFFKRRPPFARGFERF